MLFLIGLIAVVYWVGTKWGDDAGVIAVFIAAAIVIILLIMAERNDTKVWRNRNYYWRTGKEPPEWRRIRERDERREQERREINREREEKRYEKSLKEQEREAEIKRQRYIQEVQERNANARKANTGEHAVCHYCGRYVEMRSSPVKTDDGWMRSYNCPKCGQLNVTKI